VDYENHNCSIHIMQYVEAYRLQYVVWLALRPKLS